MSDTIQRLYWNGEALKIAERWILRKDRPGRSHVAVCMLFSHQFGWELRLLLNGEFQRSQVCRSEDEVFATADEWKAAMLQKGWADASR